MAKFKEKYKIPAHVDIDVTEDPYAKKIMKTYPEQREQGTARSFLAQDRVLSEQMQFLSDNNGKGNVAIINTTHALFIGWICSFNEIGLTFAQQNLDDPLAYKD